VIEEFVGYTANRYHPEREEFSTDKKGYLKCCQLRGMSVYHDVGTNPAVQGYAAPLQFGNGADFQAKMVASMRDRAHHRYILEPTACKCLIHHHKPAFILPGDSKPQFAVLLENDRLGLAVSEKQLWGILCASEYTEYYSRWNKYGQVKWTVEGKIQHGRPTIRLPDDKARWKPPEVKRFAKHWLKYAFECARHEVRTKRPPFNAASMHERRIDRLRYAQLYEKKAGSPDHGGDNDPVKGIPWMDASDVITAHEVQEFKNLQKRLSVETMVFFESRAIHIVEMKRKAWKVEMKQQTDASWFSGLRSAPTVHGITLTPAQMSEAEALFSKEIGSGGGDMTGINFLNFKVSNRLVETDPNAGFLCFRLQDDRWQDIIRVDIADNDIELDLQSTHVELSVKSGEFTVHDCFTKETNFSKLVGSEDPNWRKPDQFGFELQYIGNNPRDEDSHKAVKLNWIQPLTVAYSIPCVARIQHAFDFKHLNLSLSSNTLYQKGNAYKDYSKEQLAWMMQERAVMDVSLNLRAPRIVLPTRVTGEVPLLVLDMGFLSISSNLNKAIHPGSVVALQGDADPYETYAISLDGMHIRLHSGFGEYQRDEGVNLLQKLQIECQFKKCIVLDTHFPETKIDLTMGRIALGLTSQAKREAYIILDGIGEAPPPMEERQHHAVLKHAQSTAVYLASVEEKNIAVDFMEEELKKTKSLTRRDAEAAKIAERVSLALSGRMEELCLDIMEHAEQGIMCLKLTEMELLVDVRKFRTRVEVGMRELEIADNWVAAHHPGIVLGSPMTKFVSVILGGNRANKYVTVEVDLYKEGDQHFDELGIGMNVMVELRTLHIEWNHSTIGALFSWIAAGKRKAKPAIEPASPVAALDVPAEEAKKAGAMKVVAVMKGIEMNLNREDKGVGLAALKIQTVEFNMLSGGGCMKVDVGLGNIIVEDLNPAAVHPFILNVAETGGSSLLQITYETFDPEVPGWCGYDSKLTGHMKSLKVVFLKRKVMEIISYVTGKGILGKLALLNPEEAAEEVVVEIEPAEEPKPKRMQIDLDIESPIVHLPVGELTEETVVIRPGRITLFTAIAPEPGTAVEVNTMTIKLTGLNLSIQHDTGEAEVDLLKGDLEIIKSDPLEAEAAKAAGIILSRIGINAPHIDFCMDLPGFAVLMRAVNGNLKENYVDDENAEDVEIAQANIEAARLAAVAKATELASYAQDSTEMQVIMAVGEFKLQLKKMNGDPVATMAMTQFRLQYGSRETGMDLDVTMHAWMIYDNMQTTGKKDFAVLLDSRAGIRDGNYQLLELEDSPTIGLSATPLVVVGFRTNTSDSVDAKTVFTKEIEVKFQQMHIEWNHLTIAQIMKCIQDIGSAAAPHAAEGNAAESDAAVAEQAALDLEVPAVQLASMRVQVELSALSISMNREDRGSHIALLGIGEADIQYINDGMAMDVAGSIGDLSLDDLHARATGSAYDKLLSKKEDSGSSESTFQFHYKTFDPLAADFPGHGTLIMLKLSAMKVVYQHSVIMNVIQYTTTGLVASLKGPPVEIDPNQAAIEAATPPPPPAPKPEDQVEGANLMLLDIEIGAPQIIVPAGVDGTARIELYPAAIKVCNVSPSPKVTVGGDEIKLNEYQLSLQHLQVMLWWLDEAGNPTCATLIEGDIDVNARQPMIPGDHRVPGWNVEVKAPTLELDFMFAEYAALMTVVNGNFSGGPVPIEIEAPPRPPAPPAAPVAAVDEDEDFCRMKIALEWPVFSLQLRDDQHKELIKLSLDNFKLRYVSTTTGMKVELSMGRLFVLDQVQTMKNAAFQYMIESTGDVKVDEHVEFLSVKHSSGTVETVTRVDMRQLHLNWNPGTIAALIRFKENIAKQQAPKEAIGVAPETDEKTAKEAEEDKTKAAAAAAAAAAAERQVHLYVKGIQLGMTDEESEEHVVIISLSDASVGMKASGLAMTVTGHLGNLQIEDGRAEGAARELVGMSSGEDIDRSLLKFTYDTYDPEAGGYPGYDSFAWVELSEVRIRGLVLSIQGITDYITGPGVVGALKSNEPEPEPVAKVMAKAVEAGEGEEAEIRRQDDDMPEERFHVVFEAGPLGMTISRAPGQYYCRVGTAKARGAANLCGLCPDDRFKEVNGVKVSGCTVEELCAHLKQRPARVLMIRGGGDELAEESTEEEEEEGVAGAAEAVDEAGPKRPPLMFSAHLNGIVLDIPRESDGENAISLRLHELAIGNRFVKPEPGEEELAALEVVHVGISELMILFCDIQESDPNAELSRGDALLAATREKKAVALGLKQIDATVTKRGAGFDPDRINTAGIDIVGLSIGMLAAGGDLGYTSLVDGEACKNALLSPVNLSAAYSLPGGDSQDAVFQNHLVLKMSNGRLRIRSRELAMITRITTYNIDRVKESAFPVVIEEATDEEQEKKPVDRSHRIRHASESMALIRTGSGMDARIEKDRIEAERLAEEARADVKKLEDVIPINTTLNFQIDSFEALLEKEDRSGEYWPYLRVTLEETLLEGVHAREFGSAELKILTKVDFFSHMGSFEPVIDPFVVNLTTERFKQASGRTYIDANLKFTDFVRMRVTPGLYESLVSVGWYPTKVPRGMQPPVDRFSMRQSMISCTAVIMHPHSNNYHI